MNKKTYDFVVLGGGSAGYAAARTAHSHGKTVAVIDNAATLGGLCILRGCMPSKTLIYAAEMLHMAQKGELFGLNIDKATVNMEALNARKKAIIDDFASYRQSQLEDGRFELYRQKAQFVDAHHLKLDDGLVIKADFILIATGSTVSWPPIPGLDAKHIWTSDEILDLDTVPESVIVLGGGVVACELSQLLNRLGSDVIQIQRSSRILKSASPEAASVLETALKDEGIQLITDTKLEAIHFDKGQYQVNLEHKGQKVSLQAKRILNALGRTPNTEALMLEAADVRLSQSAHIQTNGFQQSNVPHIYAAGDCAGPHEIVHTAVMQGEIAANHAAAQPTEPIVYDHLTQVVFTDPQIAYVGMTETEMDARKLNYLSESYPFDDHGKSILMEAKYGYVKVWSCEEGIILAAECVGKDASELIHPMAVAVSLQLKLKDMLKVHWYHPTLSEIWTYPIEELHDRLSDEAE